MIALRSGNDPGVDDKLGRKRERKMTMVDEQEQAQRLIFVSLDKSALRLAPRPS